MDRAVESVKRRERRPAETQELEMVQVRQRQCRGFDWLPEIL
jgi:hypothetical protein